MEPFDDSFLVCNGSQKLEGQCDSFELQRRPGGCHLYRSKAKSSETVMLLTLAVKAHSEFSPSFIEPSVKAN